MEQAKREVKVKEDDLSGLAWTLKSLIDGNMNKPELWKNLENIKGTLVVKETSANVTSTVFFNEGEIEIKDGAVDNPTAYLAAGFDELSEVASGQVGPIKAVLTRKIKVGGNPLKLLKMAKAIITTE